MDEPTVLDPHGRDIPGEARRLRALGAVVPVTLPGGVRAWAGTRHAALILPTREPRTSSDLRSTR